jgi:cbb3-type cytochrome oxidase subunit 3
VTEPSFLTVLVALLGLLFVAFVFFALRRRTRTQARAAKDLPWRTDQTVRAEQNSEIEDRGTQAAEPASPPQREVAPARPAEENLKRFNPD